MPKRSNQFQRLVTYIAEQLAPFGATVRESAELNEKGLTSSVSREVDVLIETDAGMAPVRIALECRDRSRKDDIQWIDDLVGKYRNLDVNQIIAVSSSGFSASAKEKAEFNGIVTMSLEEASETNWPQRFAKLGVALVHQNLKVVALHFVTNPSYDGEVRTSDKIRSTDSRPPEGTIEPDVVDVATFAAEVNPIIVDQVKDYFSSNALSIYSSLADLGKDAVVERTIPVSGLVLEDEDGEAYEIEEVKYTVLVQTQYSKIDVKRHLLSDKAMVTSAILHPDKDNQVSLSAVQIDGSDEGRLFLDSKKKKRRKSNK